MFKQISELSDQNHDTDSVPPPLPNSKPPPLNTNINPDKLSTLEARVRQLEEENTKVEWFYQCYKQILIGVTATEVFEN